MYVFDELRVTTLAADATLLLADPALAGLQISCVPIPVFCSKCALSEPVALALLGLCQLLLCLASLLWENVEVQKMQKDVEWLCFVFRCGCETWGAWESAWCYGWDWVRDLLPSCSLLVGELGSVEDDCSHSSVVHVVLVRLCDSWVRSLFC